jgi:hypothetical protein
MFKWLGQFLFPLSRVDIRFSRRAAYQRVVAKYKHHDALMAAGIISSHVSWLSHTGGRQRK